MYRLHAQALRNFSVIYRDFQQMMGDTKIWRILYAGYCILIKSGSGKCSCTQVNSCVNFIQYCIWRNSHKIYWGGISLRKGCHKIHSILLKIVFKIPFFFVNNYGVWKKKKSLIREWQNLTYREKKNQYLCPGKSYV